MGNLQAKQNLKNKYFTQEVTEQNYILERCANIFFYLRCKISYINHTVKNAFQLTENLYRKHAKGQTQI